MRYGPLAVLLHGSRLIWNRTNLSERIGTRVLTSLDGEGVLFRYICGVFSTSVILHIALICLVARFGWGPVVAENSFWGWLVSGEVDPILTLPDYFIFESIFAVLSMTNRPVAWRNFYSDLLHYARSHFDPRPVHVVAHDALNFRARVWAMCARVHRDSLPPFLY